MQIKEFYMTFLSVRCSNALTVSSAFASATESITSPKSIAITLRSGFCVTICDPSEVGRTLGMRRWIAVMFLGRKMAQRWLKSGQSGENQ